MSKYCYVCHRKHDDDHPHVKNMIHNDLLDKLATQDLIEKLAALEHDQWIYWAVHVMTLENISKSRREMWSDNFKRYADLPYEMQESDRLWARKVIDLLRIEGIIK